MGSANTGWSVYQNYEIPTFSQKSVMVSDFLRDALICQIDLKNGKNDQKLISDHRGQR